MLKSKGLEFFLLFVILPVILTLDIPIWVKIPSVLIGLTYVVHSSIKLELFTKQYLIGNIKAKKPKFFWHLLILFFISSTGIAYYLDADNVFQIVVQKPLLWFFVVVIYSTTSVYFQEFVYRMFFFRRYSSLFSRKVIVFINGIVFGLAHLMFKNYLIFLMTFLGGIVFALTYRKSKSLLLTSIEHAAYGCWLFTLGIGQELAFPEVD